MLKTGLKLQNQSDKQSAIALYEKGQFADAEILCKQLCTKDTNDPMIWCLRAGIQGELKDYIKAKFFAKKALNLDPDYANAHIIIGDANSALKQPQKAIQSYLKALSIDPTSTDASCNLCSIYLYLHQLDNAMEIVGKALKHSPDNPDVIYLQATINRRLGNLETAKNQLSALVESNLQVKMFIAVSTELGKVLEKLERYDDAYNAYESSQRAYENAYSKDADLIFEQINRQKEALMITQPANWKHTKHYHNRPTSIFLVGFPRSGTTLLEQILSSHSQICVSGETGILNHVIDALSTIFSDKSPSYPDNLHKLKPNHIRKLQDIYWEHADALFQHPIIKQHFVDKLPLNVIHLPFIYRIFPNARIIFANEIRVTSA